jgi:hypothetical protein
MVTGAQAPVRDPNLLTGWKEITEHLGTLGLEVEERTARRYAHRRDALPVYRRLGQVVAHKQAIEDWVKRQTVHASVKRYNSNA